MDDQNLLLGVDLGTRTVKAVLVSTGGHEVLEERVEDTGAAMRSSVPGRDEQCVSSIVAALERVVAGFPADMLRRVRSVGVSGQMHGCVLWRRGSVFLDAGELVCKENDCSPLVTWQDQRCTEDFLALLPALGGTAPVKSGYGCATLLWYQHHQPHLLKEFDAAGTIMDMVVWALCGRGQVLMSDQNAFSWGCFSRDTGLWERDLLVPSLVEVDLIQLKRMQCSDCLFCVFFAFHPALNSNTKPLSITLNHVSKMLSLNDVLLEFGSSSCSYVVWSPSHFKFEFQIFKFSFPTWFVLSFWVTFRPGLCLCRVL